MVKRKGVEIVPERVAEEIPEVRPLPAGGTNEALESGPRVTKVLDQFAVARLDRHTFRVDLENCGQVWVGKGLKGGAFDPGVDRE
jgi:hypothetical protein